MSLYTFDSTGELLVHGTFMGGQSGTGSAAPYVDRRKEQTKYLLKVPNYYPDGRALYLYTQAEVNRYQRNLRRKQTKEQLSSAKKAQKELKKEDRSLSTLKEQPMGGKPLSRPWTEKEHGEYIQKHIQVTTDLNNAQKEYDEAHPVEAKLKSSFSGSGKKETKKDTPKESKSKNTDDDEEIKKKAKNWLTNYLWSK